MRILDREVTYKSFKQALLILMFGGMLTMTVYMFGDSVIEDISDEVAESVELKLDRR